MPDLVPDNMEQMKILGMLVFGEVKYSSSKIDY